MKQIARKDFIKMVKNSGFFYDRCKGDHFIYLNNKGRHISIPKNLESVVALRLIKEYNLVSDIKK